MKQITVASLICLLICVGCQKAASPTIIYSSPPPAPIFVAPAAAPAVVKLSTEAPSIPAPVWPRTYSKNGDNVIVYQPQIDGWKDHSKIRFRCAVALTAAGSSKTDYGVIAVHGETLVDDSARTVLITNMDVDSRFPGMTDAQAAPLKEILKDLLPKMSYLDVSLDQVLAYMHKEAKDVKKVDLNLAPPPIYFSEVPAIMVIYIGAPQFKPITGTDLMFAANTNWVVLMDTKAGQYYLLDEGSWLTSPDPVKGPWTAANNLPSDISKLPDGQNWEAAKNAVPLKPFTVVPKVYASTEPAQLIVTNGAPAYSPIAGTRLMYVSNPEMPLFWDLLDEQYYYLASGRWFRADEPSGPWAAASADLPVEFARIPSDSPMGWVLASVPKTQEAQDAILLATVPHKATINIADTTVKVSYDGAPAFVAIPGTAMTYAVNTPYQVIFASGQYYCCYNGMWFVSPAQVGPWVVCTSVPTVIYTIPPSCPVYNCTYCYVYGYTPTTVVVGYTAGYSGEYVAATGALMFGAGMAVGYAMGSSCCYSPCYYSYGCAAHYSYSSGCYYHAGGAYYGPGGGACWGSSYNPSTGTYSRSAAAYGPGGEVHGTQAYNPFTNTYGQHTGGSNGYSSWGHSYVQQGNNWAESGHQSNARGGAGYAENSSGQWAEGAHSNVTNSSVGKASNGDYYASHDGNVYKSNGDGSWQKYGGDGNWQDTNYNKSTAQQSYNQAKTNYDNSSYKSNWDSNSSQWKSDWNSSNASDKWNQSSLNSDSWARNQGNTNTASSWGNRSSGGGFGGGGGGGGFGGGGFGGGGGWGGGGGRFGGGGGFRR